MAKENKDTMVFENPDGSGKVILSKDPETGKYSVLTIGYVDVDCEGSSDGTLHIKGDITTDISIDGNVELYGNVTSTVIASGDIHCNRTAELSNTAKISPYINLDNYDITVLNGSCEFEGDIGGIEDGNNKTFITNHMIKTRNLSKIVIHKNLSIITNDEYGILHNGDSFRIPNGIKLYVCSSHESGCGIKCDCTGENRSFWVDGGGFLESFGKKFGILTDGKDKCMSSSFVAGDGATVNIYGDIGICNLSSVYFCPKSNVNIFGFSYGIKNCGYNASFILDRDSTVNCIGRVYGLVQDVYSFTEPNEHGIRHNSSFHTRENSMIKLFGSVGYMLSDNEIVDISDKSIYKSNPQDAFISIEGNLYITRMIDADYSSLPIRCYNGGGKVYINNVVVWEGKNSEDCIKSKNRWG